MISTATGFDLGVPSITFVISAWTLAHCSDSVNMEQRASYLALTRSTKYFRPTAISSSRSLCTNVTPPSADVGRQPSRLPVIDTAARQTSSSNPESVLIACTTCIGEEMMSGLLTAHTAYYTDRSTPDRADVFAEDRFHCSAASLEHKCWRRTYRNP